MNRISSALIILILFASCKTSKKLNQSGIEMVKCFVLDPPNYHNVMFNPKWISSNNISRIVEREYLDGRNGKIHLVTVLDYNKNGYPKTKYSGHGYPKDDSPEEENIFSRWDYNQENINSFVFQTAQIIRFYDEPTKRDTLTMGSKLFNPNNKTEFKNDEGEVIWTYKYDTQNRLLTKLNKEGKESFSIIYHSDTKIEIKEYSSWSKENYSCWITLDKYGRIVSDYNESNFATHEFEYDNDGRVIVDKHWFKGKEPNFHTYEYIIKDSR